MHDGCVCVCTRLHTHVCKRERRERERERERETSVRMQYICIITSSSGPLSPGHLVVSNEDRHSTRRSVYLSLSTASKVRGDKNWITCMQLNYFKCCMLTDTKPNLYSMYMCMCMYMYMYVECICTTSCTHVYMCTHTSHSLHCAHILGSRVGALGNVKTTRVRVVVVWKLTNFRCMHALTLTVHAVLSRYTHTHAHPFPSTILWQIRPYAPSPLLSPLSASWAFFKLVIHKSHFWL